MFPSFEVFCQVMDQCTENYECLVIHNNAKSNKLKIKYIGIKLKLMMISRVEHLNFGNIISNNYNDDLDEDEDFTYNKRKGPQVNVKKTYT